MYRNSSRNFQCEQSITFCQSLVLFCIFLKKTFALQGGVIRITINWDCNLDYDISYCKPTYEFRRIDDVYAKVAKGWNFRYAQTYENGSRTQFKVVCCFNPPLRHARLSIDRTINQSTITFFITICATAVNKFGKNPCFVVIRRWVSDHCSLAISRSVQFASRLTASHSALRRQLAPGNSTWWI